MTRILIVEDSKAQSLQIQRSLEGEGYEVVSTRSGAEALAQVRLQPPDVVLTDMEMPGMTGLELVELIRDQHPGVPVILMTAAGDEALAVAALQKGASSYVPKKNLIRDIHETVAKVLMLVQGERRAKEALQTLQEVRYRFVLTNEVALVPPLISYLEECVLRIHPGGEFSKVGIALHEALVNAIEHGNLEADSRLRQDQDEKEYRELIHRRRREQPYCSRRVHFEVTITPAEVKYVIRDEGPGFDPGTLATTADSKHLDRIGGRGMMLIRTFMDHVEHNEQGNQVTMKKRKLGGGTA